MEPTIVLRSAVAEGDAGVVVSVPAAMHASNLLQSLLLGVEDTSGGLDLVVDPASLGVFAAWCEALWKFRDTPNAFVRLCRPLKNVEGTWQACLLESDVPAWVVEFFDARVPFVPALATLIQDAGVLEAKMLRFGLYAYVAARFSEQMAQGALLAAYLQGASASALLDDGQYMERLRTTCEKALGGEVVAPDVFADAAQAARAAEEAAAKAAATTFVMPGAEAVPVDVQLIHKPKHPEASLVAAGVFEALIAKLCDMPGGDTPLETLAANEASFVRNRPWWVGGKSETAGGAGGAAGGGAAGGGAAGGGAAGGGAAGEATAAVEPVGPCPGVLPATEMTVAWPANGRHVEEILLFL
jgi:uncharacterized membrane protein YgcG